LWNLQKTQLHNHEKQEKWSGKTELGKILQVLSQARWTQRNQEIKALPFSRLFCFQYW
jgi:hypothetical protein